MDRRTETQLNEMEAIAKNLVNVEDLPVPTFQFVHKSCIPFVEEIHFVMSGDAHPEYKAARKLHCATHNVTSMPQTIR